MRVDVVFGLPKELAEVMVVVDVFRSSTTIVTALENGAEEIIPCASIDEARKMKKSIGSGVLLVGERMGFTPEGFDFNISPRLMKPEAVSGKKIIYCSTNLMKVVSQCLDAKTLLIGALSNSRAVARYLNSLKPDSVSIVACGLIPKNMVTLEDVIGAGAIVSKLRYEEASDTALLAQLAYESGKWKDFARKGYIANYLSRIGWGEDIELCLMEDTSNIVPILKDGVFKALVVE